MARIESIEDLKVWTAVREVADLIYDATDREGFAKDFALKNQIRRASISIIKNIAEGFERDGNKEFINFLSIAKGSCGEVRSQLYVALDRGYLSKHEFDAIHSKLFATSRMIFGLMRYLRESDLKGGKFK